MTSSNKKSILLIAPLGTSSGYGARSRDIAYALLANPNYDVIFLNTRWGNTPQNFLDESNPNHLMILSRMIMDPTNIPQTDISIQITVPNEFRKLGRYSIGITAGIETSIAPAEFLQGCNAIDHVLFSSEFSRKVHIDTNYNVHDQQTNQIINNLHLTCKSDVLLEGVNLDIYNKNNPIDTSISEIMKSVSETFCYLTVGHWLPGAFNEDRKNISGTIWSFLNAFKNKKTAPALILKSSCGTYSKMDEADILNRIQQIKQSILADKSVSRLPNIYLLHGDLTDSEMNSLYNHDKVKAMLLLTKGEGYGRPLAEFATTGKPIIVSKYSGHLDFLPDSYTAYISGKLTNVHPSAADGQMIKTEALWFSANLVHASDIIKDVFINYKSYLENSRKLTKHIKDNFSFEQMKIKLYSILDSVSVPEIKQFKLPSLKKISDDTNI